MKIEKGSLSIGQKSKFPAIALGLSLAMTAPSWGATLWDGGGGDGLWNTVANWDNGLPVTSTDILNGDTVTLSGTAGKTDSLDIQGGSTLTINTDLEMGDDLRLAGGTVNMNAGFLDQGEKFKLTGGTFFMNGGTVKVGNKLEIETGGVLEFSGGNLEAQDGDGVEFNGGTIRVNGIWTGAVGDDLIYFEAVTAGNGAYEFNPTVGGEIAPITTTDGVTVSGSGKLEVNLDGSTASTTMTLFQGGPVGAFNTATNVTIMHGATELTEGVGLNTYSLDYGSGSGLTLTFPGVPEPSTVELTSIAVLVNGDVVLTTNVPAAGLTAQQSEDLVTSFVDVASTVTETNELTIDSSLVDPNMDGADFFRVRE